MLDTAAPEELLERLIGRPVPGADLAQLLDLNREELLARGCAGVEANLLIVAAEIARRYQPRTGRLGVITAPVDAVAAARRDALPIGRTALLMLDRACKIIGTTRLAPMATEPVGDPTEAAAIAHRAGAVQVVTVHAEQDHGSLIADVSFACRLADACSERGITLIDHLVLSAGGWASLRFLSAA